LTKDVTNDYVSEVSTTGKTLHNADIARLMIEAGSELQYETLLDILDRSDRMRREKIQEGYSIQTGLAHHSPFVDGGWTGAATAADPAKHKPTLIIVPTAEMRSSLSEVGIEVLGIREGNAYIGLVTDVTTGKTDGTLTPGGQIIIAGDKIKIAPADGQGLGVFITNGQAVWPVTPLAVNHPKEIIAIAPYNLPDGMCTLYIETRYTGGNTLLNEPRRITYVTPVTVTPEGAG
jgi:hypothetical protein